MEWFPSQQILKIQFSKQEKKIDWHSSDLELTAIFFKRRRNFISECSNYFLITWEKRSFFNAQFLNKKKQFVQKDHSSRECYYLDIKEFYFILLIGYWNYSYYCYRFIFTFRFSLGIRLYKVIHSYLSWVEEMLMTTIFSWIDDPHNL